MTGRLREFAATAWEGFKGPKGSGNPFKAAGQHFTDAVKTVEKPIIAADEWLKPKPREDPDEAPDTAGDELPPLPKD